MLVICLTFVITARLVYTKEVTCSTNENGHVLCPSQNLKTIPPDVVGDDVHTIDMGGNEISSLQPLSEMRRPLSLQSLQFQGNRLENTSLLFLRGMFQLKKLDLSRNKIVGSIRKSMFQDLVSLDFLSLAENAVSCIEKYSFSSLGALTELDISFNDVGKYSGDPGSSCVLRGELCRLHSLIVLRISGNNLGDSFAATYNHPEKIPLEGEGFFSCMTQLTHLQASDCGVTSISPLTFAGLRHLANLDLSNNLLKVWNVENLAGAKSLVYVDLGNNMLEHLPENFIKDSPHLSYISLRNNELETVRVAWLENFAGFRKLSGKSSPFESELETGVWNGIVADTRRHWIDWSGNPWTCDCQMVPFLTWLYAEPHLELFRVLSGYHDVICYEPRQRRGNELVQIYVTGTVDANVLLRLQESCKSTSDVMTSPMRVMTSIPPTEISTNATDLHTTPLARNETSTLETENSDSGFFWKTTSVQITSYETTSVNTTTLPNSSAPPVTNLYSVFSSLNFSLDTIQESPHNTTFKSDMMSSRNGTTSIADKGKLLSTTTEMEWPRWVIVLFVAADLLLFGAALLAFKKCWCDKKSKRISPFPRSRADNIYLGESEMGDFQSVR